ncbi:MULTISPECIES: HNH endonuclease [Bradyrhizobium]|uniref:HNH endonuclease n=1 Tax=Bradyrhizobium septentrionale TaxID=1404411 RepID=A0A974A0B9_9BRAD|nr:MULTISPECIES: HNH endonuclease [Bradyrhizobium]QIG97770.1 HNH endonuclease [Bradyrhizobium sp. 6(2017)]UGY20226.1 HNH endonuclease [Bradyrhizobium septentrionale]UGY29069.1 HNH endonuclease [Bradyrhizobium septentrionale]
MSREDWKHFYDTAFWQRRRRQQLLAHPLCKFCAADGIVTPATHVDHVEPHRGDWTLFCLGALQSLCSPCHSSTKQRIEARGFDVAVDADGWPTDPNHPANRHR